jgi:hypothetical protein
MQMNNRKWTKDELNQLAFMKTEGTSIAVMSKILERSESAVRQRLHKLGYSQSNKRVSVVPKKRTGVAKQMELLPAVVQTRVVRKDVWIPARRTEPSWFSKLWLRIIGAEWRKSSTKKRVEG